MSNPNDSLTNVSLQKSSGLPPDLPPTDDYGHLLPRLLAKPRMGRAGWGMSWISEAFRMFREQFLLWLGIGVVYLAIALVGGLVGNFLPIINLAFSLVTFVFIGGIIKGCQAQAMGRELRFDHLFSAFRTHLGPLIILLLLYLLATIIIVIPLAIVMGIIIYYTGLDYEIFRQLNSGILLALIFIFIVAILAFIPLIMTIWFAPALIVLHDIKPVQAMKMSIKGCLKNILPFLVFGIVGPIIAILGIVLTLGLGFLVLIPVGMITYYTSYRDVWTDQPLSKL